MNKNDAALILVRIVLDAQFYAAMCVLGISLALLALMELIEIISN